MKDFELGSVVTLVKPYKGYRRAEVVALDGLGYLVRLGSGLEITVYSDEIREAYE